MVQRVIYYDFKQVTFGMLFQRIKYERYPDIFLSSNPLNPTNSTFYSQVGVNQRARSPWRFFKPVRIPCGRIVWMPKNVVDIVCCSMNQGIVDFLEMFRVINAGSIQHAAWVDFQLYSYEGRVHILSWAYPPPSVDWYDADSILDADIYLSCFCLKSNSHN